MTHNSGLCRCPAQFRASLFATLLVLTFGACDNPDLTEPVLNGDPIGADVGAEAASFSSTFRGGIPFGTFAQPTSAFGSRFNGAMRNIYPNFLLQELATIKGRGGKVVLMFAGHEKYYKEKGRFSMTKWKARVNRFRSVNFTSYINDGTIIGHYLIDEPQDRHNWGQPITGATLEEMAKYSKQFWPNMPTIVRAEASKIKWNGKFRHLDAAWAQYVYRRGDVNDFLRKSVADAHSMGLALIVGLNITKGSPSKSSMTASQLQSAGSAMLNSSYPCAFISWQYNAKHMSRPDVQSAMSHLAGKARSRPAKSCRAGGKLSASPGTPRPDTPRPNTPRPNNPRPNNPRPNNPPAAAPASISLKAAGWKNAGSQYMRLTWSGVKGSQVDVYRNGARIKRTRNDGHDISSRNFRRAATYVFKVCQKGTSACSRTVRLAFR